MTKNEAIEFYNSKVWENWDAEKIVRFQLFNDLLCVDFDLYLKSLSIVLKRNVYTHELAFPELLKTEYLGCKDKPTLKEIADLIPEIKRVIIEIPAKLDLKTLNLHN